MMLPMFVFSACSDDDDDIDSNLIEGSWGLVHSEGFDNRDMSEPLKWDFDCNPLSPSSYDDFKMDIIKLEGNEYYVEQYYWSSYSRKWQKDETYKCKLDGNTILPMSDDVEIAEATFKIKDLTSTNLTLEAKEGDSYYSKEIFKRLQ